MGVMNSYEASMLHLFIERKSNARVVAIDVGEGPGLN